MGETALGSDMDYIVNYVPDRLYVHPAKNGAYASIAADSLADGSESVLAEIEVSERTRLAVTMFHVTERDDWNRLKITKLEHKKREGWRVDGEVVVSRFDGSKLAAMLSVLSSLDLAEPTKAKIDLQDMQVHQLTSLLGTSKGRALVQRLSQSPELEHDIVAVAAQRRALTEFERLLAADGTTEPAWQAFFEANPWVFGYGLAFVFFSPVGDKLESVTTGAAFDRSGKRADGLLRTRAAVSQRVLVEIKRSDTALLQSRPYRPGTWGLSHELSDAVVQRPRRPPTTSPASGSGSRPRTSTAPTSGIRSTPWRREPTSWSAIRPSCAETTTRSRASSSTGATSGRPRSSPSTSCSSGPGASSTRSTNRTRATSSRASSGTSRPSFRSGAQAGDHSKETKPSLIHIQRDEGEARQVLSRKQTAFEVRAASLPSSSTTHLSATEASTTSAASEAPAGITPRASRRGRGPAAGARSCWVCRAAA